MGKLQSIKKSLGLDEEIATKYEFCNKIEQLEESKSQLNKALVEIVSLLAEAKEELETSDMKAINQLITEIESVVIDYSKLEFQQLKRYATLRGVESKGKKKEDLLKELAEL